MSQVVPSPRGPLLLTLAAGLLLSAEASAAPFVRGDVNQDGVVDISDPVGVLLFLFAGEGRTPDCLDAADVNDSGAVDLSDAVYGLGYLFLGGPAPAAPYPVCAEDPSDDDVSCDSFRSADCPPPLPPEGHLTGSSGCKGHGAGAEPPNTEDCIQYAYGDSGTLSLKHINAGFNCCATVAADISVEPGQIHIVESETYEYAPCACLCLFDLDMEILNLPAGDYVIWVDEVVAPDMKFAVSLAPGTSDIYCEKRDGYPWGM